MDRPKNISNVLLLNSLCFETITRNSELLETCCTSLPRHVYEKFMMHAFRHDSLLLNFYSYCSEETTSDELLHILENIDKKIHLYFSSIAARSNVQFVDILLDYANHKALTRLAVYSQFLTKTTHSNPPTLLLWKFQNLKELSIYYDDGEDDIQHKQHLYQIMQNIFEQLPDLIRLEICDLPLTNKLSKVLTLPGVSRLDCLSLSRCQLAESDLIYLSTASLKLQVLYLSNDNILTERNDLLRKLLLSLTSTLTFLELENCIKSDNTFVCLVTCVLSMRKLRYLGVLYFRLSWTCRMDNISLLSSMEQLDCVQLCDGTGNDKWCQVNLDYFAKEKNLTSLSTFIQYYFIKRQVWKVIYGITGIDFS